MTTRATSPNPESNRPALSIALLECDHVDPEIRDIAGDYGDMFVRMFHRHTPEIDITRIDVINGVTWPDLGAHDGILITGSRHSTGDDLPWIHELARHLRDAHARQFPVAGICFGHQLIAQALGGRVQRAEVGWGVGVHTATVTTRRDWMDPPVDGFRILVNHQDQVVDVPPDGVVVATSDHAPVAAFEAGSLLGFQGHPEFDAAYADALMTRRRDRIGDETLQRARATLDEPTDQETVAHWIGQFFRAWQPGRPHQARPGSDAGSASSVR